MPFRPPVDRLGRILARCPQCLMLWKTKEIYPEIELVITREAYGHLRRLFNSMPNLDREKALAEIDEMIHKVR